MSKDTKELTRVERGQLVEQNHEITPWTPRFVMSVDEAVAQVEMKRQFMQRVMVEGLHYGTIPGTPKPSLWKPGAELLLSAMGLHPELVDAADPTLDITGKQHGGEPFIEYRRACLVWRQTGPRPDDRMLIARAEGSCSSWETKYRYRDAKRKCPDCGAETIYESKKGEGGWFCWLKKGGCGHEFALGDERISGQPIGKTLNSEIPDLSNTILKIADKRAFVAGTLLATGCSDIFTQDMADEDDEPRGERGGGRRNGNGRAKANANGEVAAPSKDSEQHAELVSLLEDVPESRGRWSVPMFNGKLTLGYEKCRAELIELRRKAGVTPVDPREGGEAAGGDDGPPAEASAVQEELV
jgi:hypothetical protein